MIIFFQRKLKILTFRKATSWYPGKQQKQHLKYGIPKPGDMGGVAKSKYITIYLFLEQTLWAGESSRQYPERFLSIWMYLFSKIFGSRLKKISWKTAILTLNMVNKRSCQGYWFWKKYKTSSYRSQKVFREFFKRDIVFME